MSRFADPEIPSLRFCRNDVEVLADLLRESGSFKGGIVTLVDEQATQDWIFKSIDDVVKKIDPGDLLLLYFSTHGKRRGDISALVTYDSIRDRLTEPDANYIAMSDLLDRLPPLRTFLIVTDCCHQGSPLPEGGFSLPASLPLNIAGFQSSLPNEFSIEHAQLQHGVFSYYLIQGLRGEANRGDKNDVSVFDLHTYVTRKVRDYTNGRQNPVLTYRGSDDFVVASHPPTHAQKAKADLLDAMASFSRAEAWSDVLDTWDELLHPMFENDDAGLPTAIAARQGLDDAIKPSFELDARSSLGSLRHHPRVWPCLRIGNAIHNAIHPRAQQTHQNAAHGDLLLGIKLIEGKIAVISGVYVATTSAFPAVRPSSDRESTRDIGERERIAYYALAEKQIDLDERSFDLEDFRELPWRELVTGERSLQSLTRDLRAMDLWTPIRAQILKRYPREVVPLFELELQPLQHMASVLRQPQLRDSELQTLREIGLDLIEAYVRPINGADRDKRNQQLMSTLASALHGDAPDPGPEPPHRRPTRPPDFAKPARADVEVHETDEDNAAAPLSDRPPPTATPEIRPKDAGPLVMLPGERDVLPSAARDAGVPSGAAASSAIHGAPASGTDSAAPADLWLTIHGDTRTLRADDVEIWRRTAPPFDWTQPLFSDPSEPSRRIDLDSAKRELPDWDRERAQQFGTELGVLLLGSAIPDTVRAALTVDAGDRRRLVLDLDGNAARAPWEYLYLNTGFIRERRLSVVRHVKASGTNRVHPLILAPPPRAVVFAEADPFKPGLEIQAHRLRIERELTETIAIHPVDACTPDRICDALAGKQIDGFHFLGHGELDSRDAPCLVVHPDQPGQRFARLYPDTLTRWLGDSTARFVFLGACHSGDAAPGFSGIAEAIVRICGIPVVAMQLKVPQQFSTSFATRFYQQLRACGYDLERAVYQARQFEYADRHALGIPVLFADVVKQARPVPELSAPPPGPWAKFTVISVPHPPPRREPDPVSAPLPVSAPAPVPAPTPGPDPAPVPAPTPGPDPAPLPGPGQIPDPAPVSEPAAPRLGDAQIAPGDDALQIDWDAAQRSFTELRRRYALADDLLPRIAAELEAGRHVVLTGPVGTGKTNIASEVVHALGYTPYRVTASAEWTSFEVVGGFFPHALKDGAGHRIDYAFRPGVFVEAVYANWEKRAGANGTRDWHRKRADQTRGTWLVLDEINRADIDRALGGVFTALESLRLRIPVASVEPGSPATVEIPIPQDFRILATMNGVDRHYLFRLSDALKRRFAFIEVPVPDQLSDEWQRILRWCKLRPDDLPAEDARLYDALRRFTYLVRAFYPVGTAQLLAAVRFLIKSRRAGLAPDVRLYQAVAGSILPGLEEAPRELLRLLRRWAESRNSHGLFEALTRAPGLYLAHTGTPDAHEPKRISPRFRRLLAQLEQVTRDDLPTPAPPPTSADDAEHGLLRTLVHLAVRQHEPDLLPLLYEHLSEMARA